MIETKHERDVWVYRRKNVVYAEFNTGPECAVFEKWHKPESSEFPLSVKQELRGLDHVNLAPEGYEGRYQAYIDGLCEAYAAAPSDTVKIPNTMEIPASIVGMKQTESQHIIYLLELILQAIKEK